MTKAKRLVTACADGYMAFWECDFECKRWHVVDYLYCDTMQTGVYYSNTADRLLSWSNQAGDYSMNVWDVRPGRDNFGEKVGVLQEHDGIPMTCLELDCHVGEVMVTGGTDGVLIVWDVTLTPHVQELPEVISRIPNAAAHKRAIGRDEVARGAGRAEGADGGSGGGEADAPSGFTSTFLLAQAPIRTWRLVPGVYRSLL